MRIISDLEQGTPEWLQWRQGGIGASDAPILLNGKHFERTYENFLATLISGEEDNTPRNTFIMERGKQFEPLARSWYERRFKVNAPPLCAESSTYPFIRASLDGWLPNSRITLEIKYADKVSHELALTQRKVTPKYTPQLLHQILVTESPLVHYVSGNPRFPSDEQMALCPFRATQEDLEDILTRLCITWEQKLKGEAITFKELETLSKGRIGEFKLPPTLAAYFHKGT